LLLLLSIRPTPGGFRNRYTANSDRTIRFCPKCLPGECSPDSRREMREAARATTIAAAEVTLGEQVYELQVLELGSQGGGELGAVAGLAHAAGDL
jgi:hypothetical protein